MSVTTLDPTHELPEYASPEKPKFGEMERAIIADRETANQERQAEIARGLEEAGLASPVDVLKQPEATPSERALGEVALKSPE